MGAIGRAGLVDPGDLRFYAGMNRTGGQLPPSEMASGWGMPDFVNASDDLTTPVLIAGTTVLIVPLLLLVGLSSRLGGAVRNRRLAAIRLAGATSGQIRRIATGEVLVGAGVGLLLGGLGFLIGRLAARWIPVSGRTFFPTDMTPSVGLLAAIVVLVPLVAVVMTITAQNRAITRPLNVTRAGQGGRRRLVWRLTLLAATATAVLAAGRLRGRVAPDPADTALALVPAIALALLCIPVFVPYLVELAARNLSRGRPSWQLAVRRLQLDSSTASRACSGIAVVLAGAVALLPLLHYAADQAAATAQVRTQPGFLRIDAPPPAAVNDVPELITAAVPAGAPVAAWANVTVTGDNSLGHPIAGSVAGCATILVTTDAITCRDGDVFEIGGQSDLVPGAGLVLAAVDGPTVPWQLPTRLRSASSHSTIGITQVGLLITPAALTGSASELLSHLPHLNVVIDAHGTAPLTSTELDGIRNALASYAWRVQDDGLGGNPSQVSAAGHLLMTVRAGLIVGGGLVLIVAAAGLVMTTIEQVTERHRSLVLAAAAGVPRKVLGQSLLVGTALPAALALIVADAVGLAIPLAIQPFLITPLHVSITGLFGFTAAGLALVVAVTALALPVLYRFTKPESLRTE